MAVLSGPYERPLTSLSVIESFFTLRIGSGGWDTRGLGRVFCTRREWALPHVALHLACPVSRAVPSPGPVLESGVRFVIACVPFDSRSLSCCRIVKLNIASLSLCEAFQLRGSCPQVRSTPTVCVQTLLKGSVRRRGSAPGCSRHAAQPRSLRRTGCSDTTPLDLCAG